MLTLLLFGIVSVVVVVVALFLLSLVVSTNFLFDEVASLQLVPFDFLSFLNILSLFMYTYSLHTNSLIRINQQLRYSTISISIFHEIRLLLFTFPSCLFAVIEIIPHEKQIMKF